MRNERESNFGWLEESEKQELEKCFELLQQYHIKLCTLKGIIINSLEELYYSISPTLLDTEDVIGKLLEGMEKTDKLEECLKLFKSNSIFVKGYANLNSYIYGYDIPENKIYSLIQEHYIYPEPNNLYTNLPLLSTADEANFSYV